MSETFTGCANAAGAAGTGRAWRSLRRTVVACTVAASTLGALATTSPSARADSDDHDRAANVVYVESNVAVPGENAIFAFRRAPDGSLTQLPGSPFSTSGTGVIDPSLALGPFDADQQIILNPERTLLFAVNGGSDTIAVFHVQRDGALVPVNGSPFPSGGIDPASVGLSGDVLTVVNKDNDPNQAVLGSAPNYTTFRVHGDGSLEPIPGSTVSVPAGSSPTQALAAPFGNLVFSTDFFLGQIESFELERGGRLEQNVPTPVPSGLYGAAPHVVLGLAANSHFPVLYVGFVPISTIGVYVYDREGDLAFANAAADSGAAVCWLRTNREGTRLYASNTGDRSITVYDITDPLTPVELQHLVLSGIGSSFEITLDSRERFLYVVTNRASSSVPLGEGNTLHVLAVDPRTGLVTEVPSSPTTLPVPPGTRSQGVAAL